MGLPYRFETVSFPPSAAYPRSPLGSMPFLQDDGGVAINESIAMIIYLAQKYGPTPLLPGKDDQALRRVLQVTVFGEAAISAEMNSLLAAHFAAPRADKRNWSVRTRARIERAISYAADMLGDGPFLADVDVTLADHLVELLRARDLGALGKPLRTSSSRIGNGWPRARHTSARAQCLARPAASAHAPRQEVGFHLGMIRVISAWMLRLE